MMDRTNFDEVFNNKMERILAMIEEEKTKGNDRLTYPFFFPADRGKHFDGFKGAIIDSLKEKGYHVTNFLPGYQNVMGGTMKDMYICWSQAARDEVEGKEGYEFR